MPLQITGLCEGCTCERAGVTQNGPRSRFVPPPVTIPAPGLAARAARARSRQAKAQGARPSLRDLPTPRGRLWAGLWGQGNNTSQPAASSRAPRPSQHQAVRTQHHQGGAVGLRLPAVQQGQVNSKTPSLQTGSRAHTTWEF